ncbi:OmpA family protein [Parerythrobacter aestuarii]|uniref:OmpA family protein n=1 Tax=Parerythrobacter aestuarii TaxID=3020909 RepID=UPI0024DE8C75|nr:OmpA family protein [Parerythrobacter aestuarii]
MHRTFLLVPVLMAASACSDTPASNSEEPVGMEAPEPAASEPVSIIRPDIEEAVMIPLEALNATIVFRDSGSELSDDSIAQLETLLEARQLTEGGRITLRGHSDAGGRDEVNLRISQERAESVRDWLVENGVAEGRIKVIAFGEQNPAEPNALPNGSPNEAGRAANRRVEVTVDVPAGTMIRAEPAFAKAAEN